MLPLISISVGLLLGSRFNFLILIPASAFGLALTVGSAMARAESVETTVLATIIVLASLQLGYIAGAAARPFLSTPFGGQASVRHAYRNRCAQPVSDGASRFTKSA